MAGRGKKFPVEGVSWLEQLFEMVAARGPDQKPLTLFIPDTYVLRYQRPAALYTSDSIEENTVSCRDDLSELLVDSIYNRFVKKKDSPDKVCAVYVYIDKGHGHEHGNDAEENEEQTSDAHNVVVEYMNPPQLRFFLQHRPKFNNGILQRFSPSKGSFHTTIRVMWTPRTCHVETRANLHKMDDTRISVTDRLSTFDGGPHLSISHNLKGGLFHKNIKEAADSIVRHVETLIPRPYQVWETVLYFKYCASAPGSSDNAGISFLWCSSMRVFKDELLDLRCLDQFWTSEHTTEVIVNKEAPNQNDKVKCCPITGKNYKDGTDTQVMVAAIVKYMTLHQKLPNAPETLKFIQDAAELDEQSTGKDTVVRSPGGRGNTQNKVHDELQEKISEMMKKKTAARDVCNLIKRVLFGNPEAPDASELRAIFNHEMFLKQNILVSEDAALDALLIVERESLRAKAKSTPSNDAAELLAKSVSKHMKKTGVARLMPASVVEVNAIVVGHDKKGGANSHKVRPVSSKLPMGHGDVLNGMPSQGTLTTEGVGSNVGAFSHADSTHSVHPEAQHRHVDIQLGKSNIMSFRRLKYLPMGAPGVRGPLTIVEQGVQDADVIRSPENETAPQLPRDRTRSIKFKNADEAEYGNGILSRDNVQGDGTLDSSVMSKDSAGLTDARRKVLGQYAAFGESNTHSDANNLRNVSGRLPRHDKTHDHGLASDVPKLLHADQKNIRMPYPTETRIGQQNGRARGASPQIQRPYSEYKPREMQGELSQNRRPFSAQYNGAAAPASTIKHYNALDSEWSHAVRDGRNPTTSSILPPPTMPHPSDRATGQIFESQRRNFFPSADSRHGPGVDSRRIASANRRDSAKASSSASTRVSSAISAATKGRRTARTAHFQDDWSDGDLIDDDDQEDWDDGLEMDLPSTHSRLKRDNEARASREAALSRHAQARATPDSLRSKATSSTMPLCLQWGLDDRVRAKVLQQYSAYG